MYECACCSTKHAYSGPVPLLPTQWDPESKVDLAKDMGQVGGKVAGQSGTRLGLLRTGAPQA